jgi:hypothetical protein
VSQTDAFIRRLSSDRHFGPIERARLRALAGRGLDHSVAGFDLFTGLWWPLRKRNGAVPPREVAWLIANLLGAIPLPHVVGPAGELPVILGACERRKNPYDRPRFRRRFEALLCAPLGHIEPHLRWGLAAVRGEVVARRASGLNWVQLTDDLRKWDRGQEHLAGEAELWDGGAERRLARDVRDRWAEQYLNATGTPT